MNHSEKIGFTNRYIEEPNNENSIPRLQRSFKKLRQAIANATNETVKKVSEHAAE